jgi:cytochrome P450
LRSPLATLERWGDTDDSAVSVDVAGRRMVVLGDPELAEQVLLGDPDTYRKAAIVRERLGTLQGGSLVLLDGDAWRRRRETVESAFTPDRVATTDDVTTRYAAAAVDTWPTEGVVAVDEAARDLVLAVLARTLFGLDLRGGSTPIHEAAEDVLARMDLRSVSTYLPEWVPTPTNRRFRRAVATLHDRLDETVDRHDGESAGEGDSLLSALRAAGLSTAEIRDELVAFLFAGFDSTATALACVLGTLGDHPVIQAELYRELQTTVAGRPPSSAKLGDLELLDAVVRETLRLYPPQYALFREPTTAVTLGEHHLPATTTLVLPPWVYHRDDRFWEAPEAFRPRRWLGEDTTDRPPSAYLPYGRGPRHCVGVHMANQILRLVVAVVCSRRRFETVETVSVSAGPTLSLDGGVELRVSER